MAESSANGQKTLWEKEKLVVTSNFSFSHSVLKRLGLQTYIIQGFFGKGLTLYQLFVCLSDGQTDHQRSAKIRFHSLGLGGEDKDRLLTLTSVKKRLNHSNVWLSLSLSLSLSLQNCSVSCKNKFLDAIIHSNFHFFKQLMFKVPIATNYKGVCL